MLNKRDKQFLIKNVFEHMHNMITFKSNRIENIIDHIESKYNLTHIFGRKPPSIHIVVQGVASPHVPEYRVGSVPYFRIPNKVYRQICTKQIIRTRIYPYALKATMYDQQKPSILRHQKGRRSKSHHYRSVTPLMP